MDVHIIQWPGQESKRAELQALGALRILMVDPDADAPVTSDALEDWIRLPANPGDLRARVEALKAHGIDAAAANAPIVGADGVLRCGAQTTVLAPVEQRLVTVLLERQGAVVSREALLRSGWPDARPDRNVLDVHIGRLRKRLKAVDLVVTTVRSRGYMLEPGSTNPAGE